MASENDFMNVSNAATLLGVHIQTLRRLARQKKIPAFKLGRDWRFRRQALVRWADSQLFVPKPVDSEILEQTVRTIVGERLSSSITAVARSADGGTP